MNPIPRNAKAPSAHHNARGQITHRTNGTANHIAACADVHALLSRLSGVRELGPDRWRASCPTPAHARGDRSQGLSIRLTDDGRVLLWCGVGCTAAEIVSAIGLTLADLFPPRTQEERRAAARRHEIAQALALYERESSVLRIGLFRHDQGHALTTADIERMKLAERRLSRIEAMLEGAA